MADILEGPRVRVSSSQLSQYIGKPVCFVGRLEKLERCYQLFLLELMDKQFEKSCFYDTCSKIVRTKMERFGIFPFGIIIEEQLVKIHQSGKFFFLSDGEGKNAAIELNIPLEEEISGIIEVVGRVTNQLSIVCSSYIQFKEDKNMFDLSMYNEAVKVIHEFPEYYPFSTDI